ncbi:MAG: 3-keto-disaccharide hydrolase [Planctomycetota bacterium]
MSNSFPSQLIDELKLSRRYVCRTGLATLIGVPLAGFCDAPQLAIAQEDGSNTPTPEKPPTAADVKVTEPRNLLDPKEFPKGWRFFTEEKNAQLAATWQLVTDDPKQPYLKCTGKPFGYLRTLETFGDYEFGLEWRYPTDVAGNSGILLHTADEDRIWPNSIQVQLHRPQTGSVFPSGDAKSDNRLDVKDRDLPRELNVWNKCRIECREGRISVEINGKRIGAVTGCQPAAGAIALQSEGAEVHFQNIWMKPLSKPEQPTA